jgi:hypothetical protein
VGYPKISVILNSGEDDLDIRIETAKDMIRDPIVQACVLGGERNLSPTNELFLGLAELGILKRADALPSTGVGGHHTEVIDHDLSREPSVAFVPIGIFPKPRIALRQRLNCKLRELDPSGNDRLAAPDLKVEPPDRDGIGRRRQREINVVATAHAGQLLT